MFGGRIVTAPDKYCYTSRRVKQPQSGAASTNSGCLMVLILLSTLLQFDCRLPPDKTPMLRPIVKAGPPWRQPEAKYQSM